MSASSAIASRAIGDLASEQAGRVIDATGLVVAPGFIDVQGQSGTTLLADGNGESHLRQGITSEIIGEGGSPAFWTPDTDGLGFARAVWDHGRLDRIRRLLRQAATDAARRSTSARSSRPRWCGARSSAWTIVRPPPDELSRMEAMVDQAMRDGAFGLSSALIYVPGSFAKTDELVALAKVAAKHKGIYITHIRGESFNLFNALDEAIAHRPRRRAAGRDLSPQGRREGQLGPHERGGGQDREGQCRGRRVSPRRCIPTPPAEPAWPRRCRCGCRRAAATRCSSG